MAAFFFDLDGTCLKYHENEWLPGVREKLESLSRQGHQIYFITMRGLQDHDAEWSLKNTQALLAELTFPYLLLHSTQSPRIIIDDGQNGLLQTETDNPNWLQALEGF